MALDMPPTARKPPEFILEIFADASTAKDLISSVLHVVFFHRYFPSLRPKTSTILDLSLPYVDDVEIETLIDQRVGAFVDGIKQGLRNQATGGAGGGGGMTSRGEIVVKFFERKRRRTWYKSEEESCWEAWVIKFTLATPRSETGMLFPLSSPFPAFP
jgi:autophagy-related protein 101